LPEIFGSFTIKGVSFLAANLTPQYYEAEEAFKKASTIEEKISALEEMLAVIPKHKGTEKIQADLKRRLSKLRDEGQKKQKPAGRTPFMWKDRGPGRWPCSDFPTPASRRCWRP
jgi:hypothetical protein